jgi:hypothetical protein
MKKLILFLLFLVAISASAEPLSVQVDQGCGMVDFATPTVDVSGLTNIGANIPEGCKVAYITVINGPLLINDKNDLATGTYPVGILIASGTINYPIEGISTVPGRVLNLWARPNSTASVTVKLCGWK